MEIKELESGLNEILDHIVESESRANIVVRDVADAYKLSARNLLRYLILRNHDLRPFHDGLTELGISSMRTSEGYVLSNLTNSINLLRMLQGKALRHDPGIETVGYKKSAQLLRSHASNLFIERHNEHITDIMITLPEEAAEDRALLKSLVVSGMKIARINLSHGNEEVWTKMVDNLHSVRVELQSDLKIYMDLSGPKIRTSEIRLVNKKGISKESIKLQVGDQLILTKRQTLGREPVYNAEKQQLKAAEIGVLLPQIIDDVKEGDHVYFDDGMIKAVVIAKNSEDAILRITKAYKSKLSSHKGINLPKTVLNLPSLTDKDVELLQFVCAKADIVGYSFVRNSNDVSRLYAELEKYENEDIGVVFKIENREAFENLPLILIEGMRRKNIGVMIARGDLAVEIGFERISEVQNQIMWICESAHVPVIWATQVLDNLAKTGVATRAEISDAALSTQAECVMLNKGPYILDAAKTLQDIINRMKTHSVKKKSALRPLNVAKNAWKHLVK